MRALKRWSALLLGGLLLAACTGCAESGGTAAKGTAQIRDTSTGGKTTAYNLQLIEPTAVSRTADISAAPSYQMVKSIRTDGEYRLKTLCVSRGSHVEAGDPIAVLQGTGAQADVELKQLEIDAYASDMAEMLAWYESAIDTAKALPQSTEREKRVRELQVEYAQLECDKYELQMNYTLDNLKKQLDALKTAAGEVTVTSPISGTVRSMTLRAAKGDTIAAGTEICRVCGDDGLLLSAMSATGTFVYGREVQYTYGRGKNLTTVTGRVVCSPEVLNGGYGSLVLMELDVDAEDFPELEGNAETTYTVLNGVYAVPKNCITNQDGKSYVQVLVGDTARTRMVVRGPSAGGMVTILHGLHAGDQVIVSSYNY